MNTFNKINKKVYFKKLNLKFLRLKSKKAEIQIFSLRNQIILITYRKRVFSKKLSHIRISNKLYILKKIYLTNQNDKLIFLKWFLIKNIFFLNYISYLS